MQIARPDVKIEPARPAPYGRDTIERGGIVGIANLIECVPSARRVSRWRIEGHLGFKLKNVRPRPFQPLKGALGFFEIEVTVAELREGAYL